MTLHLLTACGAHYHIVPAGKVDFKECNASVTTMIPWNGLSYGDVETWTVNGPELENMLFHLGIEDGKNLASSMGGESNVKMPKPMDMFRENTPEIRTLLANHCPGKRLDQTMWLNAIKRRAEKN